MILLELLERMNSVIILSFESYNFPRWIPGRDGHSLPVVDLVMDIVSFFLILASVLQCFSFHGVMLIMYLCQYTSTFL